MVQPPVIFPQFSHWVDLLSIIVGFKSKYQIRWTHCYAKASIWYWSCHDQCRCQDNWRMDMGKPIEALLFDSTASNTPWDPLRMLLTVRCCILLASVAFSLCRHLATESILDTVFIVVMAASSEPDIQLFKCLSPTVVFHHNSPLVHAFQALK